MAVLVAKGVGVFLGDYGTSLLPTTSALQEVCCVNTAIPTRAVDGAAAAVEGETRELQKVMMKDILKRTYLLQ